jgi:hypothetical protein
MDEDSAALQYYQLGCTEFIPYDDESYALRFYEFLNNKKKQDATSRNLRKNLGFLKEENLNEIVIKRFRSVFS